MPDDNHGPRTTRAARRLGYIRPRGDAARRARAYRDRLADPDAQDRHGDDRMISEKNRAENLLQTIFPRQEGAQYWFRTRTDETSVACSGLATRAPPTPVTPETTFHCFSTTKPITALAVLQLVMEGSVSLDAPLATYLPDLPYRNGATASSSRCFPTPRTPQQRRRLGSMPTVSPERHALSRSQGQRARMGSASVGVRHP